MRLPIAALLVVGSGIAARAAVLPVFAQTPVPDRAAPAPALELYHHTIAPRDALIALSRALLVEPRRWPLIQQLNHVRNPRRLKPGSTLGFPIELLKSVPATAAVLWVRGSARVAGPDGTGIVALVGTTVAQGERVTTGAGEAVGLRLSTGATITLGEHADVAFTELRQLPAAKASRTGLELRRGRIQNEVTPATVPNQRYEIRTPVVTTAVRGTSFRVGVDEAGATVVAEVSDGRVGVARATEAVDVPAGFGSVARAGVPLAAPRALLPAPAVAADSGIQQRLPVRLRWPAVPGAVRYRAEVRPGTSAGGGEAIVDERLVPTPDAQWADLADGAYRVTIRGIDADGLEGTNAETRLEVDARPEPPIAQDPVVDAVVIGDRAAFAWTRPAGVATFDLEIAPAPGSDATPRAGSNGGMLADAKAESTLPPGRHTWRVRSRATLADGRLDVGPWSDALGFTVKARPPAGPAANADTAGKATLALRWAAGVSGDRYRVQLARDATFASPIIEEVVAEPALSTPRPAPGTYAVRIAIVNADGIEGPFGPVQSFEVPKLRTRSWWWLAEPIAVLAGLLVAM